MKLTQVADSIAGVCSNYELIYDPSVLPIKIGPDLYIFYATPLTDECHSAGACRVLSYYAHVGGPVVDILNVR